MPMPVEWALWNIVGPCVAHTHTCTHAHMHTCTYVRQSTYTSIPCTCTCGKWVNLWSTMHLHTLHCYTHTYHLTLPSHPSTASSHFSNSPTSGSPSGRLSKPRCVGSPEFKTQVADVFIRVARSTSWVSQDVHTHTHTPHRHTHTRKHTHTWLHEWDICTSHSELRHLIL